MSQYLSIVLVGMVTFPLIAFLLLIPYMVFEYRRYGAIPLWKSIVVFSAVLYAICAYYLVILPLPADRSVFVASAAVPNLVPFEFVGQFAQAAREAHLSVMSPTSWRAFLSSADVYMTLFNALLTVPVGFYAHYIFGARWWQATLAGFAVSLFFELTQLSGLYGIYAHPYRLFDVNDLIVNTAGAWLGFVATLPMCRWLPSFADMNAYARERGRAYPSLIRCAVAFIFDAALAFGCVEVCETAWKGAHLGRGDLVYTVSITLAVTLVFIVIPALARGATIGQHIVRIRLVSPDGQEAPWWRVLGKQALLWWGLIVVPLWIVQLFPAGSVQGVSIGNVRTIVMAIWFTWGLSVVIRALVAGIRHRPFVSGTAWATGTRLMSVSGIESLRAQSES